MAPQLRLVASLVALVVVGTIAAALGRREVPEGLEDRRRSTLLTGPWGARGWYDALALLDVRTSRERRRIVQQEQLPAEGLYALLDPGHGLTPREAAVLASHVADGGAVLASGAGARTLMRCAGWAPAFVTGRRARVEGLEVEVFGVLRPLVPDGASEGLLQDGTASPCELALDSVDVVLGTDTGEPVILRFWAGTGTLTLVADGTLFANRQVRETDAGIVALSLVAGRHKAVTVDEFHHGFGPGGSLWTEVRRWLATTPPGWLLLQLGAVTVVMLLAAGVRFGPARAVAPQRRRSPLEHVRALATALAAARGHRVAVRALVRGLRRRLAAPGVPPRGSLDDWLDGMARHGRDDTARGAAARLRALMQSASGGADVQRAAHTVEDLWQHLTP